MAKWKIPDLLGFSTLIDYIKQAKKTSDASASDVSGLRDDIQGLADQTTATFGEVDSALAAMDNDKLDKPNAVAVNIPASGWGSDTSIAAYPKYYDLAVAGITAKDRASVYIAPTSIETAKSCGICPTCETLAGKIRIRAAQVPSADISAEYWIEKGLV